MAKARPDERRHPLRPANVFKAFAAVLALGVVWVGIEVVRISTAVPGANPGSVQQVHDLIARYQPAAAAAERGDPNAYEIMVEATDLLIETRTASEARLEQRVAERFGETLDNPRDWSGLRYDCYKGFEIDPRDLRAYPPADAAMVGAMVEVQRGALLEHMAALEGEGVWALADGACGVEYAERVQTGGTIITTLLPALGATRQLALCGAVRMRMAADAGDAGACAQAFETNLMLARVLAHQPTIIERLVGEAIVSMTVGTAMDLVVRGELDGEACRAMLGAMDRQLPLPPASLMLEGERLMMLDAVQWTHSDDGHGSGYALPVEMGAMTAFGTPGVSPTVRNVPGLLLPRKRETIAEVNRVCDELAEQLALGPRERDFVSVGLSVPPRHRLVQTLMPSVGRAVAALDQGEAQLAGVRAVLAVEAWRGEHGGEPPATLDELVPGHLREPPADPFAPDGRLRYRVLDGADALGRVYLVYSVGLDGVDDGGVGSGAFPAPAWRYADVEGTDRVINAPPAR